MSNFKAFTEIIGVKNIASFLNVTTQMISKSSRQGYAPSDWYHRLVLISKGCLTYEDLYNDLYLNKLHCKPEVVKEQAEIFTKSLQLFEKKETMSSSKTNPQPNQKPKKRRQND